jgi:hypothetical protein
MITVRQIKAARALLDWSDEDLADRTGLSGTDLSLLQAKDGLVDDTGGAGERIRTALQKAGVIFLGSSGAEGVGVRLRRDVRDEGLRPQELTTENDD